MASAARSGGRSHAGRGLAAYSAAARSHLNAFVRNESGATAIEYALIGAIITIGTIAAMTTIGTTLSAAFDNVAAGFNN